MAAKLRRVLSAKAPSQEEVVAAAHARRKLQEATGLEGRYLEATFDAFKPANPRQAEALRACRAYAQAFDWSAHHGAGIWLLGPCGTGKSHLAAGIVHALFAQDEDARFTSPAKVVRQLRQTWGVKRGRDDDEELMTEEDTLSLLGEWTNLLVLDDVGAWRGTDAELVQLAEVIDRRSVHRKPTVITSNLTSDELREALGERTFDRLSEGAQVLIVDGTSYRSGA